MSEFGILPPDSRPRHIQLKIQNSRLLKLIWRTKLLFSGNHTLKMLVASNRPTITSQACNPKEVLPSLPQTRNVDMTVTASADYWTDSLQSFHLHWLWLSVQLHVNESFYHLAHQQSLLAKILRKLAKFDHRVRHP